MLSERWQLFNRNLSRRLSAIADSSAVRSASRVVQWPMCRAPVRARIERIVLEGGASALDASAIWSYEL